MSIISAMVQSYCKGGMSLSELEMALQGIKNVNEMYDTDEYINNSEKGYYLRTDGICAEAKGIMKRQLRHYNSFAKIAGNTAVYEEFQSTIFMSDFIDSYLESNYPKCKDS